MLDDLAEVHLSDCLAVLAAVLARDVVRGEPLGTGRLALDPTVRVRLLVLGRSDGRRSPGSEQLLRLAVLVVPAEPHLHVVQQCAPLLVIDHDLVRQSNSRHRSHARATEWVID